MRRKVLATTRYPISIARESLLTVLEKVRWSRRSKNTHVTIASRQTVPNTPGCASRHVEIESQGPHQSAQRIARLDANADATRATSADARQTRRSFRVDKTDPIAANSYLEQGKAVRVRSSALSCLQKSVRTKRIALDARVEGFVSSTAAVASLPKPRPYRPRGVFPWRESSVGSGQGSR
jgi:hypothetical protein